ncbi:hypothetical protein CNYM01_11960 [Colletotrichum nymphaeae SA-01]|uniref:Uncharacterized protein n=1 Tax=Colletotrichum nymphaeae SA-01 TaxID=1460502 RepID=A0A135T8L4_9PEZI|nr:hypothetical protein CNYM01_11960 [Colletotrichum nymphaeae SA-01]
MVSVEDEEDEDEILANQRPIVGSVSFY